MPQFKDGVGLDMVYGVMSDVHLGVPVLTVDGDGVALLTDIDGITAEDGVVTDINLVDGVGSCEIHGV